MKLDRGGWFLSEGHVYPKDDLRDHEDENCWCKPTDDEGLIVHHSMDKREDYENGKLCH